MQQRDSYTCDDIEGAHAGWKPRHEAVRKQGPPHEIMKTDDIVFDGVFHSQRVSTRLGLGGGGGGIATEQKTCMDEAQSRATLPYLDISLCM